MSIQLAKRLDSFGICSLSWHPGFMVIVLFILVFVQFFICPAQMEAVKTTKITITQTETDFPAGDLHLVIAGTGGNIAARVTNQPSDCMGHGPTVTTQNGTNTVDLVWDDNCVGRNQSVEVEITGDYGVSLASATWTYKFAPGSALPDIPDSSDVDIAKDVTVVDVSEGAFLTGPVIGLIGLILLLVIFLMIRRRPPSGDGAETKE